MIHRIIICDDNKEEAKELEELANEYYKGRAKTSLCINGSELEKFCRKEGRI